MIYSSLFWAPASFEMPYILLGGWISWQSLGVQELPKLYQSYCILAQVQPKGTLSGRYSNFSLWFLRHRTVSIITISWFLSLYRHIGISWVNQVPAPAIKHQIHEQISGHVSQGRSESFGEHQGPRPVVRHGTEVATPTRSESRINRLILQVHSNLGRWSFFFGMTCFQLRKLCKNHPTPFHPMILEALIDECGRDAHPQRIKLQWSGLNQV